MTPATLRELLLESLRHALTLSYSQAYDEMTLSQALQMAGGVVNDLDDTDLLVEVQKLINDLTTFTEP